MKRGGKVPNMNAMNDTTKSDVEVPVIRVFVPPVSGCAGENTWENAVQGIEHRLCSRFGNDAFEIELVHLFSAEFFRYPEVMQLVESGEGQPAIVTVNGAVLQKEGKLSERKLREALEHLGM